VAKNEQAGDCPARPNEVKLKPWQLNGLDEAAGPDFIHCRDKFLCHTFPKWN
jgi:hypothetical protein